MPVRRERDGIYVNIRLTPKASANKIIGVRPNSGEGQVLAVSVTAVPEKRKANSALLKMLAKLWGIPKTSLSIRAGSKDRHKTIFVNSLDADVLVRIQKSIELESDD